MMIGKPETGSETMSPKNKNAKNDAGANADVPDENVPDPAARDVGREEILLPDQDEGKEFGSDQIAGDTTVLPGPASGIEADEDSTIPPEPKTKSSGRKRKDRRGTLPIGILGFSGSGKTVFLSALYHATAEERKFKKGWRARWTDSPTARYLRDVGHGFLGIQRSGRRDWTDASHMRVRRTFPEGTMTMDRELRFTLIRSWCRRDFETNYTTIDASGEIIHSAFRDGIENLSEGRREEWEKIAELSRDSRALLLFVNILNLDEIQSSGEMTMLLEWVLQQARPPRAVGIVVTGIDVLANQSEVLAKKAEIEKRYARSLELLEEHDVANRILMVSSLGPDMVRKKTEGLDPGCLGASHKCQRCQELVEDPDIAPQPIGLADPFEFLFHHFLPWYYRWPPLGVVVGFLAWIRRVLFNRIACLLFFLLLGALYWFGESSLYARLERLASSSRLPVQMTVFLPEAYCVLYWWETEKGADLRRMFKSWRDLGGLLKRIERLPLETQVDELQRFIAENSNTPAAPRAREHLVGKRVALCLVTIERSTTWRDRLAAAAEGLALSERGSWPKSRREALAEAASEIFSGLVTEFEHRVENSVRIRRDVDEAERIQRELSAIMMQLRLDGRVLDAEGEAGLQDKSEKWRLSVRELRATLDNERLFEDACQYLSAGRFQDASFNLKTILRRDADWKASDLKQLLKASESGLAGRRHMEKEDWAEAESSFRLIDSNANPHLRTALAVALHDLEEARARSVQRRLDQMLREVDRELLAEFGGTAWRDLENGLTTANSFLANADTDLAGYRKARTLLERMTEGLPRIWTRVRSDTEELFKAKKAYAELEPQARMFRKYLPKTWAEMQELLTDARSEDRTLAQRTSAYRKMIDIIARDWPRIDEFVRQLRAEAGAAAEKCRAYHMNVQNTQMSVITANAREEWQAAESLMKQAAAWEINEPGKAKRAYELALERLQNALALAMRRKHEKEEYWARRDEFYAEWQRLGSKVGSEGKMSRTVRDLKARGDTAAQSGEYSKGAGAYGDATALLPMALNEKDLLEAKRSFADLLDGIDILTMTQWAAKEWREIEKLRKQAAECESRDSDNAARLYRRAARELLSAHGKAEQRRKDKEGHDREQDNVRENADDYI